MIEPVSEELGYALPVTFTTNVSLLPAPGHSNHAFVSKGFYGNLVITTLLVRVLIAMKRHCDHSNSYKENI